MPDRENWQNLETGHQYKPKLSRNVVIVSVSVIAVLVVAVIVIVSVLASKSGDEPTVKGTGPVVMGKLT